MQQNFFMLNNQAGKWGKPSGRSMYIADGHCDSATAMTPLEIACGNSMAQLDFPRFLAFGNLQIFAFFLKNDKTPEELQQKLREHIQDFYFALELKPKIQVARSKIQVSFNSSALAVLSLEGADLLAGDETKRQDFTEFLYHKGFRSLGLFWNNNNWAGCGANSNAENNDTGLSLEGKAFARYLFAKNWLVDLAHSSRQSFWDVAAIAEEAGKTVFVSHTCCDGLCSHKRNLDDRQLKKIGQLGGLVGITLVPSFLSEDPKNVNIQRVAEHIKYAVNLAGIDSVGLGSDFDGTAELPDGIFGYEDLPMMAAALEEAGFSPADVEKLMGQNWRRFLTASLPV